MVTIAPPIPPASATSTAMTIVLADESEAEQNSTALLTRLAELAVDDEVLVVYGASEASPTRGTECLVVGLRDRLPRYDIVALYMPLDAGSLSGNWAMVEQLMEIGNLPVVVTTSDVAVDVATELAAYLCADRVLTASCTSADAYLLPAPYRRRRAHKLLAALDAKASVPSPRGHVHGINAPDVTRIFPDRAV